MKQLPHREESRVPVSAKKSCTFAAKTDRPCNRSAKVKQNTNGLAQFCCNYAAKTPHERGRWVEGGAL